jgi:CBS-domain-containing membrane protein
MHARKLRRAGFRMNSRLDFSRLQNISAREIMQPGNDHVIPDKLPLAQVARLCVNNSHESFYILSENGELTGTISSAALRQLITEYEILKNSPLIAQDIASPGVVTVSANDDLAHVMQLFTASDVDELPVVAATNAHAVVGSIRKQNVIAAYHQALLHQDLPAGFARGLRTLEKAERVQVAPGYALLEIAAPLAFAGKTLAELRLRQQHGVAVIMIRRPLDSLQTEQDEVTSMPDANYRFQEGDVMVLFGEERNLAQMEKL